jgi:integrase
MTINRAATLTAKQIDGVVEHIHANSDTPERDELMFLLSHLAGLRVSEIVKLNLDTSMLDADGRVPNRQADRIIHILSNVGKMKKARDIPMHPRIADALKAFIRRYPDLNYVAFAPQNHMARMSVNNLTVWFHRLYKRAALANCSSHSGRRSFATRTARVLNQHGQSLRDLQDLMGHARLDTTQRYIEPTNHTHNMIGSL